LITNNAKELAPLWRAKFPVDEIFDEVVDSSAVGFRKPEPEIFNLALGRLRVTAAEAVLLDDMEVNVTAARALGLHAIQVGVDEGPALGELDRLLARSVA
jgi:HAD superfamily hydrolase (TIGR01509 family)